MVAKLLSQSSRDTKIRFVLKNPKRKGGKAWLRYESYKWARTTGEALDSGAAPGDLDHDFCQGFVRKIKSVSKYAIKHTLSLGTRCVLSEVLREHGLRRYAGPFDWVYSNVKMVDHILKDNFKKFLDPKLIKRHSQNGFTHKFYAPMLLRSVVFPHHDPVGKDKADYARKVKRFQACLKLKVPILIAMCNLIESQKALSESRQEEAHKDIINLFKTLRQKCGSKNLDFFFVNIVCGEASEASGGKPMVKWVNSLKKQLGGCTMTARELHCVGDCTGLRLTKDCDNEMLGRLVAGSPDTKSKKVGSLSVRCWDLDPDPIEKQGIVKTGIVKRKIRKTAGGVRQAMD